MPEEDLRCPIRAVERRVFEVKGGRICVLGNKEKLKRVPQKREREERKKGHSFHLRGLIN